MRSAPTPLQVWTVETFRLLDEARDVLTNLEYEVFVDGVLRRVPREAIRIGLDDWREAA